MSARTSVDQPLSGACLLTNPLCDRALSCGQLPGSDHPAAGKGQRSQQHLEELTSLVDGHIDLRESLAQAGRVPPIDPSNSLTRIGVGSTKLRPLSMTAAMPPC